MFRNLVKMGLLPHNVQHMECPMACSKKLALFAGLILIMSPNRHLGQESPKALSPIESYKAALAPLMETRNQPNDLTDADKFALGIGIAQASRDCLSLSSDRSGFADDPKELFALGQLCILGQQFEPARATIVDYLALPQPPEREQALSLLVRALLGSNNPRSAEPQVRSLLRDYPYDALIHKAIDQVIDATEGANADQLARELCATQSAATLPLLAKGRTVEGSGGSVSAATLFADAVRCAALVGGLSEPATMGNLAEIAQQPNWKGTADLAPMLAVLKRQQMTKRRAPASLLQGYLVGSNSLVPSTIALQRGTVLLIPFTLWSPSFPEVAGNLAKLAAQRSIYAITSWHANTGREDVRSSQVLDGLRSWQHSLPKRVPILIVPDSVLDSFHIDVFPAGILIRKGKVLFNMTLSSEGTERLLVSALNGNAEAH
jgi:hypothetical protein